MITSEHSPRVSALATVGSHLAVDGPPQIFQAIAVGETPRRVIGSNFQSIRASKQSRIFPDAHWRFFSHASYECPRSPMYLYASNTAPRPNMRGSPSIAQEGFHLCLELCFSVSSPGSAARFFMQSGSSSILYNSSAGPFAKAKAVIRVESRCDQRLGRTVIAVRVARLRVSGRPAVGLVVADVKVLRSTDGAHGITLIVGRPRSCRSLPITMRLRAGSNSPDFSLSRALKKLRPLIDAGGCQSGGLEERGGQVAHVDKIVEHPSRLDPSAPADGHRQVESRPRKSGPSRAEKACRGRT